jgi:DNA-binding MarR family transcriptional regulator
MVKKRRNPDYHDVLRSTKTLSTWVLLDFTRFAISKLRDTELATLGLTPEQTAILKILDSNNGSSTIRDISEYWMRQPHSVSTLINRMAKQGMVEKIKHPKQKEFQIVISPKGRELYSNLSHESLDEVFSNLSVEDLQKLSQFLQLLLIKARKMAGFQCGMPVP